jgi:ribosomal protein S24E
MTEATFSVEDIDVDTETNEIVVAFDTGQEELVKARVELAEVLGAQSDRVANHRTEVPLNMVEVPEIRDHLAERHDVDPDDVMVMRIDAPGSVYYDLRQDHS